MTELIKCSYALRRCKGNNKFRKTKPAADFFVFHGVRDCRICYCCNSYIATFGVKSCAKPSARRSRGAECHGGGIGRKALLLREKVSDSFRRRGPTPSSAANAMRSRRKTLCVFGKKNLFFQLPTQCGTAVKQNLLHLIINTGAADRPAPIYPRAGIFRGAWFMAGLSYRKYLSAKSMNRSQS